MKERLERLKTILENSSYTVALCGNGVLEEGGGFGLFSAEKANEIERKYHVSPEEIFTGSYYNTRPAQFFDFYKNEVLSQITEPTETAFTLAAMERAGVLHCIVTSLVYDISLRGGCKNVISLRGSVYNNQCPRCGRSYPMEYVRDSKHIPICESCSAVIRPMVSLYGEMQDSQIMTRTTEELRKADVLLFLGASIQHEVFKYYTKYFKGSAMVVINESKDLLDYKADLVINDQPQNVLPLLGY